LNAPPEAPTAAAAPAGRSASELESIATALSAAPPPAPPLPERISDAAAIRSVLAGYRSAFAALDVSAVEAVWPAVNSRALRNAFDQLASQKVDFECVLHVTGARANAVCGGTSEFVPAVGSRTPRVEPRDWIFYLARVDDGWVIERVDSR
jgi:hypothetical protein